MIKKEEDRAGRVSSWSALFQIPVWQTKIVYNNGHRENAASIFPIS
jgi:hypothetical protein